jgi:hypothetical protein
VNQAYRALLLAACLASPSAWAQAQSQTTGAEQACFTFAVDFRVWDTTDGNTSQEHHFTISFRPSRYGDAYGIFKPGEKYDCAVANMDPGDKRRFFIHDLRGKAVGRIDSDSRTAVAAGVTEQNRGLYITLERKQRGAVVEFNPGSPIESPDAEFINGAADSWDPVVIEFTEEELKDLASARRIIPLRIRSDIAGLAGKGSVSLNASFEKVEEEMLLLPDSSYASWLPAPLPELMPGIHFDSPGKPLQVTAKIQAKQQGQDPRKGRIYFVLEEVTRHSGRTGNYPRDGAEKDDLKFSAIQPDGIVLEGLYRAHTAEEVTEATIQIEATDTAAFGKLKASAPTLQLKAIYKPDNTYALTIPRDTDGNRIADAWEGRALDPASDDEKVAGQDSRGDGLTAADEYRGFVVLEGGRKVFRRMDPKRKELFVIDEGGLFDTKLWETASGIVAYRLDESLVKGGADGDESRIVTTSAKSGEDAKYAVRLEKMPGTIDPDDPGGDNPSMGYSLHIVGGSPKDAELCKVFPVRVRNYIGKLYTWLGIALAQPNSKEGLQLAKSGFPRFLAQRALDQLSEANRESLVRQMLTVISIHEVGHACGLAGHIDSANGNTESSLGDKSCPMRYPDKPSENELIILQILFGSNATLPLQYNRFCRDAGPGQYECFRKLNVQDGAAR